MIQAKDMRIGDIVESYGTNGNPNGWSNVSINAAHIDTAIMHPEWFRPIKRFGVRISRPQLEWIILIWWWACGFFTSYLTCVKC